jgi:hypothetical protein
MNRTVGQGSCAVANPTRDRSLAGVWGMQELSCNFCYHQYWVLTGSVLVLLEIDTSVFLGVSLGKRNRNAGNMPVHFLDATIHMRAKSGTI